MNAAELAQQLDLPLVGDAHIEITGLAPLADANPGQACFVNGARYLPILQQCRASLVLLREQELAHSPAPAHLLSQNPYLDYARMSELFAQPWPQPEAIHATAIVGDRAVLGANVRIAAGAVIEDCAVLGDNVVIGAQSVVGRDVCIGANSRIDAQVVLYPQTQIGKACRILSGAVIGADGFGYAERPDKGWQKIAQLGGVKIGDHVEIGANTTIDRGALQDTKIGDGVIIDNLVQIAHNVEIGANSAIAGCVGIAGSAVIGENCRIGGAVGILGHLQICDNVIIGAKSIVRSSIEQPGAYASGTPLMTMSLWRRACVRYRQLDQFFKKH